MEFKKNSLREKINGGGIALGTAIYSFSPAIVELAGFSGLDFCRIDNGFKYLLCGFLYLNGCFNFKLRIFHLNLL